LIAEPPPAPVVEARARQSGWGCAIEIVETLVLTVVIFFVIQNFVAQPFQVQMDSMEHSLEPGDYVLVDKISPHWDAYSRGNVVVFDAPSSVTSQRTPYIKRVIGVGGDTIELKGDGLVYVNGTALTEHYLFPDESEQPEPTDSDQVRWIVPEGDLFVMGDHRQVSSDSRAFGPIPIASVVGRAILRYWPISEFGVLQMPTYDGIPPG
jgi:signal peptidase I